MALIDFSLPASDPLNPNGVTSASDLQRRLLAAQLMQKNGSDTSPIQSPWQGAARMVQAALGGWDEGQMNKQSAAGVKANSDALAAALGGMGAAAPAAGGTVSATPAASADGGSGGGGALPIFGLAAGQNPAVSNDQTGASLGEYLEGNAKLNGANPVFQQRLLSFLNDNPAGVGVMSFDRDPERQAQLWAAALQKYGSPEEARKWVAPPGHSNHNKGMASDLSYESPEASQWAHDHAAQYGLAFPLANEPWHVEPMEARGVRFTGGIQSPIAGAPTQVASLGSLSGIGGAGASLPATTPLPPPRPANLGAAPAPAQVASNDSEDDAAPSAGGQVAAAAPSAAPQAQAAPVPPARPAIDVQKLLQVISSPYSTPAQQQIATALLQSAVKPKDPIHVGDSLVDPTTYKTLYSAPAKADAAPTSVREYEYGLSHPDYVKQQQILNQKAESNHVVSPGAVLLDPKGHVIYKNQGADMSAPETQNTVDFLARRVLAGDPQALTNIGRGAQGGEMVRAVQGRVAEIAKEQGIDPKTILGNQADFSGQKAEQRTLGTQNARVTSAATEAKGAAQMAIQALDNLPRSNVVPANKLWQMGESALSDPNLKSAQLALMTLKNTYARAINPNGTPHMGDKEHFDQLMSTADGPEATHAAIGQILREVEMAQQSPAKAMKILQNIRAGKSALDGVEEGFGSSTAAPTAAPQVNVPSPGATHIWTPNGGLQKVQP